jgi:predicted phage-related endonuclease
MKNFPVLPEKSDPIGIEKCYLRALFGGNHIQDYEIEYNTKFVTDLVGVAEHFINEFVIPDKEPPPDASKEYSKFLSLYYPDVPDKSQKREASASSTDKIQKWALLREEAKQLDSKIQAIKNELEKEIIDNNLYGYTSLYASVSRYKVSGRAKDGEILKHLVEKHNLQTEYDELKNKPEFRGEDYHVINIYPKKIN